MKYPKKYRDWADYVTWAAILCVSGISVRMMHLLDFAVVWALLCLIIWIVLKTSWGKRATAARTAYRQKNYDKVQARQNVLWEKAQASATREQP